MARPRDGRLAALRRVLCNRTRCDKRDRRVVGSGSRIANGPCDRAQSPNLCSESASDWARRSGCQLWRTWRIRAGVVGSSHPDFIGRTSIASARFASAYACAGRRRCRKREGSGQQPQMHLPRGNIRRAQSFFPRPRGPDSLATGEGRWAEGRRPKRPKVRHLPHRPSRNSAPPKPLFRIRLNSHCCRHFPKATTYKAALCWARRGGWPG